MRTGMPWSHCTLWQSLHFHGGSACSRFWVQPLPHYQYVAWLYGGLLTVKPRWKWNPNSDFVWMNNNNNNNKWIFIVRYLTQAGQPGHTALYKLHQQTARHDINVPDHTHTHTHAHAHAHAHTHTYIWKRSDQWVFSCKQIWRGRFLWLTWTKRQTGNYYY